MRDQTVTRSEVAPGSQVAPGRGGSGTEAGHDLPRGRNGRNALLCAAWTLLLPAIMRPSSATALDVSVSLAASNSSCRKGDLVKYTITAAGASATGVTIVFPNGLYVLPSLVPSTCRADAAGGNPTTVTCSLSGAASVVLWVETTAVGTYSVVAGAVGSDYDSNLANNTAVTTLTVSPPGVSTGTGYYTLPPCRVIDTRAGSGLPTGYGPPSMPGNGSLRNFSLTNQCGIPTDAVSVSTNVSVWAPVTRGDLAVFSAGGTSSGISMLFWDANILALANAGIVKLGSGGAITVRVNGTGTVDLILDVNGYFR